MVARLWPGSTVVLLASGPSLTQEDVDYVRGKARVIAVNTTYQIAKWADAVYATDSRWWKWNKGLPNYQGLKFGLNVKHFRYPSDVVLFKISGEKGLELDPAKGIRHGQNSGYAAINVAVHLGAKRLILLGYDCQEGPKGEKHWHKDHPMNIGMGFYKWRRAFETLPEPLKARQIEIVNCTRRTALECFPQMPIEQALPAEEAVA